MQLFLGVLLAIAFTFVFISSSFAKFLGIDEFRIYAFTAVMGLMFIFVILLSPKTIVRGQGLPVVLLGLLAWIALAHSYHDLSLLDFKIVLPVLALLLGAQVYHFLSRFDLLHMMWSLLALYIVVTFLSSIAGSSFIALKGHIGMERLDISGSLIDHSVLCVFAVVLASCIGQERKNLTWFPVLAIILMATLMLMANATRTVFLTLSIMAVLSVVAGPQRAKKLNQSLKLFMAGAVFFFAYAALIDGRFLSRFFDQNGVDFSSGRLHSIIYWIGYAADYPLGHGIGTVRQMLMNGNFYIAGGRQLEWPHNEVVRFFVEGGLPGLVFIVCLISGIMLKGLRAAAMADPVDRAAILFIVSDMISRSMLQNYFNSIYSCTIMLLLFAYLAERSRYENAEASFPQGVQKNENHREGKLAGAFNPEYKYDLAENYRWQK